LLRLLRPPSRFRFQFRWGRSSVHRSRDRRSDHGAATTAAAAGATADTRVAADIPAGEACPAAATAAAAAASVSLACTSKATTANCHLPFASRSEERCNPLTAATYTRVYEVLRLRYGLFGCHPCRRDG
jgi:hypothetical protein